MITINNKQSKNTVAIDSPSKSVDYALEDLDVAIEDMPGTLENAPLVFSKQTKNDITINSESK